MPRSKPLQGEVELELDDVTYRMSINRTRDAVTLSVHHKEKDRLLQLVVKPVHQGCAGLSCVLLTSEAPAHRPGSG